MRFAGLLSFPLLLACVAKPPGSGGPKPDKKIEPVTESSDPALAAVIERVTEIERANQAHENTATTRFEAVAAKLEEIQIQLDEVERLAKAKPVVGNKAKPKRKRLPDPGVVYSVPIADAAFDGPKHALVTIVVGLEYTEPYSRKLLPVLDQVRSKFGKKVKVVYQNFIVHKTIARSPALAVCAAAKLGRYRDMVDAVFPEYDFGCIKMS